MALGLGLAAGLVAAWLCHPGTRAGFLAQGLWRAELATYDYRLSYAPHPRRSTDLVLVTIDDESMNQGGELSVWPWPRRYHARVIKQLHAAGAKVIGVDMVLAGSSGGGEVTLSGPLALAPLSKDDEYLAGALKLAGNVVLAMEVAQSAVAAEEAQAELEVGNFPVAAFEEAALDLGCANLPRDLDGVVRRAWTSLTFQDEPYAGLAVALAAHYLGVAPLTLAAQALERSRAGHPALGGDSLLISYGAPIGLGFERIPYYRVLQGDFDPAQVRGKMVLIGSQASVLQDLHYTPLALRGERGTGERAAMMPGVEIVAHVAESLVHGRYLVPLNPLGAGALTLLVALAMAALTVWLKPVKALLLGWLPLVILAVVGTFELFWERGLWVPLVPLVLGVTLSYGVGTVYLELTAEREQRRLRQAWAKRVSPEVLAVILNNPGLTKVHGRRLVGTVFFSDLQDFTKFCNTNDPERVVEQLNRYFTAATEIIRKHGGTLHKFIGDGIMAVFGDPVEQEDHARRAVRASQELVARLAEWKQTAGAGDWPMHVRIGLHTGELVAGDVGSEDLLEYTVMGDTVSTASRLEGMNKELGTQILLSADTAKAAGDSLEFVSQGTQSIRGREGPLEVFTLKEETQDA
jgi:adenylate cyclase